MAYQTDLEVILEFLEEHCRQETRRRDLWENSDFHQHSETSHHLDSLHLLTAQNNQDPGSPLMATGLNPVMGFDIRESGSQSDAAVKTLIPSNNTECITECIMNKCEDRAESSTGSTPAARGRKLRLFHFLFEMLEDPGMAHCVSWVPASAGVFRFSSAHKEHVAKLWGQRKGNRRPMTYQKMSRALRNYTRSGEIIKVRKKLTYQFSRATLITLRGHPPDPHSNAVMQSPSSHGPAETKCEIY